MEQITSICKEVKESQKLLSELSDGLGPLPHYRFHPRVWQHRGDVVDLGCGTWDWSRIFLGTKRVIGSDPCERYCPEGAELWQGMVGNFTGHVLYDPSNQNRASAFRDGVARDGLQETQMITLADFRALYRIDSISLLKMNIEGMEYDLLIHLKEPIADQLVITFHDYPRAPYGTPEASAAMRHYLSQWYDYCATDRTWGWYVFLKR